MLVSVPSLVDIPGDCRSDTASRYTAGLPPPDRARCEAVAAEAQIAFTGVMLRLPSAKRVGASGGSSGVSPAAYQAMVL